MDWIKLFKNFNDFDAFFFDPVTETNIQKVKEKTGTMLSGQLLDLLLQTDGIKDNRFSDYLVFNTEKVIEYYLQYLEYLIAIENEFPHNYLFFADDGCGNHFGFEVDNGIICTGKVGVYYCIENKYRIVAPDLYTWAVEWHTGKLSV